MKKKILLGLLFVPTLLFAQTISKEDQIKAVVQAAPEEQRAGAKVWGYNNENELIVLREGTNKTVCLADNPNDESFSLACYHIDLEPFMSRGRALKKEGKSSSEIFEIREVEAKNGKLKMPNHPSTLHVLYGADAKYNTVTAKVENANYRYVVYIPFATAESTGLPTKPMTDGGPWIMNPGSHRAHIMITPPWPAK